MEERAARIQRRRVKGWRLPAGAVCVTRPGRWGNPFKTADAYGRWLASGDIAADELGHPLTDELRVALAARRQRIIRELPTLRGKSLACFCPTSQPCHADILLALANR